MTQEKLPTRAERMAELEKDAEVMRWHFSELIGVNVSVITGENNCSAIKVSVGGYCFTGRSFRYRPDPVAPAKWDPVFFMEEDDCMVGLSSGDFYEYDELQIEYGDRYAGSSLWCSVNNRDHHSDGWKREWEPDYNGGDK